MATKKSRTESRDLAALRKRAEEKLHERSAKLSRLSTEDIKTLVEELGRYQIELEIQNEELRMAQEELETSRRKYADLYDFAPVGYFTFDAKGLIKEVNLTGIEMLGQNRSLLINKPFPLFLVSDDRNIFHVHLRNVMKSPDRQTCEIRLIGKKGSQVYVRMESIATAKGEDGAVYCRSAVSDLAAQKKAEEQISKLNMQLKQKIGQLEISNKDWEMFSHAVSHELRTPLFSIDGFSRMTLKKYADRLDVKGREYLTTIMEAAKQMGHLLDDLSAFSRASAIEIMAKPDRVNMKEIARRAYEELKPVIGSRNVRLEMKSLPFCHGDLSLLKQVFANLLSNAIKFTEPKEIALLEVGSVENEDEIEFYVKDNGVGFDMEHRDKLFNIFQRLHSPDDFKGTGAGLAIVRMIVEKHGGRVRAESETGTGATFYFTLPANKCFLT